VKPTKYRRSLTLPVPDEPLEPEHALEVVRRSFYLRLHDEKARLAALAVALRSCKSDAGPVFGELEMFAHRLRGAAAVFDAPELSEAAKALELAAAAASAERAHRSDCSIWCTLELLSNQLATLTRGEASPSVACER
jgi:HPt (histidine-containing phosphotransfer) domain-containing protein